MNIIVLTDEALDTLWFMILTYMGDEKGANEVDPRLGKEGTFAALDELFEALGRTFDRRTSVR